MDAAEEEKYFDRIDQQIFQLKHVAHNWLRSIEGQASIRPPSTRSGRSQKTHRSSSTTSSKSMAEMAITEKIKVAELEAQADFHEERVSAESALKRLKLAEKIHAGKMRAKIYEEDASTPLQVSSNLRNERIMNGERDDSPTLTTSEHQRQQRTSTATHVKVTPHKKSHHSKMPS